MYKKFILLILGFILLLQTSVAAQRDQIIEVTLTIEAPFSEATISIERSSLTIQYLANSHKVGIQRQYNLPRKEIKKITLDLFNKLETIVNDAGFWQLRENYTDSNLMDASRYTLSIKALPPGSPELADAYAHTVSCYGECPEELRKIIQAIKELWGKEILEIGI